MVNLGKVLMAAGILLLAYSVANRQDWEECVSLAAVRIKAKDQGQYCFNQGKERYCVKHVGPSITD